MSLPVPGVGTEDGPQWATDLNNCMAILDQHNHAAGSGVQINPGGININSDLAMNSNNLTIIRSLRFLPQGSPLALPTDLGCLYESGVDLYYNDANGNQIQITSGGGVAGSPGSIGSLTAPASATYIAGSKTFVWQSGVNKAAAMDNGGITIRETDVAAANGITLVSPTGLGTNYQLTLPGALPGSTQFFTSSAVGLVSFSTANQIAQAVVRPTGTSVGLEGVAISGSSGGFTTNSTSFVSVTNLSVTIQTSGRPVYVGLSPDPLGSPCYIGAAAGTSSGIIRLLNGASPIALISTPINNFVGPSSISAIDTPVAGTYTYSVEARHATGGANSTFVNFCLLVVYEL